MQSRTLLATVNTQISLRQLGPLTVCLLSVWALSPLGSQSCLRIFSTGPMATSSNRTLFYVDTTANEMFAMYSVREISSVFTSILDPVYIASILSPPAVKNSSMDLWGNVKIPYFSSLDNPNSDDWLQLSNVVPEFSSLLGIPLTSMETGNTTLSLESTYLGLDCSAPATGPEANVITLGLGSVPSNGTFWTINHTRYGSPSLSNPGYLPAWTLASDRWIPGDTFLRSFANATDLKVNQSRLLFQSARSGSGFLEETAGSDAVNSSDSFVVVVCGLSQIYVESNVTCQINDKAQNCEVTAQRPSQLPHPSSNLTVLSLSITFGNLVSRLIKATNLFSFPNSSSFAEYYLQNTSTSFILTESSDTYEHHMPASLGNVSAVDFSRRLGQLLNTYFLGSQIYNAVAGGEAVTGVNSIHFDDTGSISVDSTGRNTTASLTQTHEVYVCSWPWLAVLILASVTMLTASLLAAWWEYQTRIPDILGYCSTLTRDAPYLNLQGGNTLDGMERTRLLKDYRITLGVVEGSMDDDGVGHIAVVPAGKAERPVKGQLYA